jgi:hypothetical protein
VLNLVLAATPHRGVAANLCIQTQLKNLERKTDIKKMQNASAFAGVSS